MKKIKTEFSSVMIPYFQFLTFTIGPLTFQVWGFFVALGILVGTWVASRCVKKMGLDSEVVWDLIVWIILFAFIFARIFHIFYEPIYYFSQPFEILAFWQGGFSIIGGFVGAIIAGTYLLKKKKLDVLKYIDAMIFGLPIGIGIGRIGCFIIHDHPGVFTNFFLGVKYPDGVRLDHGLLLSIEGFILFLIFVLMSRRKLNIGTFIATFLVIDGLIRFILDFFRAYDGNLVDTRYLFLTIAQYFSLLMIACGIYLYKKLPTLPPKADPPLAENAIR